MSVELQVKETLDQLGRTIHEFQAKNDAEIAELKKKGSVDPLLSVQVKKANDAIEELTKQRQDLEKELAGVKAALSRPGVGGEREEKSETLGGVTFGSEYKTAFDKFLRKGDRYLSAEEQKALSVGTSSEGGYLFRPEFRRLLLQNLAEQSPLRRLATVITVGGNSITIASDSGTYEANRVGETASRPETATGAFGTRTIDVAEMYAKPKATQWMVEDNDFDLEGFIRAKIGEAFTMKENTEVISGTGSGQAQGILTPAAGTGAGQIETVSATLSGDALIDTQSKLKARYQANARWLMNGPSRALIRKLKDGQNRYIWQDGLIQGEAATLLGKPVEQVDELSTVGAGVTAVAYGDFKAGYWIIEKLNMSVLVDPYSAKPFVEYYARRRMTGAVVDYEAIKRLGTPA